MVVAEHRLTKRCPALARTQRSAIGQPTSDEVGPTPVSPPAAAAAANRRPCALTKKFKSMDQEVQVHVQRYIYIYICKCASSNTMSTGGVHSPHSWWRLVQGGGWGSTSGASRPSWGAGTTWPSPLLSTPTQPMYAYPALQTNAFVSELHQSGERRNTSRFRRGNFFSAASTRVQSDMYKRKYTHSTYRIAHATCGRHGRMSRP